jgi:hypothetical protein
MGNPANQIFGMDRLLFGTIIGGIVFILAMLSDVYIRKINEGNIAIKYQKVLIPIAFLVIVSIIADLLIKIRSL